MIYKEPYWTYWQLLTSQQIEMGQVKYTYVYIYIFDLTHLYIACIDQGSHPTDKKPSSYYMTEIALGPHKNIWQGGGTNIQVNMSHNLNRPYMYCTYTSYLR